jgi:dinuclear metal center YbgI/SA1388 family protein
MIQRQVLLESLDALLNPSNFTDYCPNGLQIEGNPYITRIATAVSSTQFVIDRAIAHGAQALLVHHGLFWKNDLQVIVGNKKQRIARILKSNLNLIAYHLPLDVHPEIGNNVQLAAKMHWPISGTFGPQQLISYSHLPTPITLDILTTQLNQVLNRPPFCVGETENPIQTIAFCTGAAQDFIEEAANRNAQVFISGEISERTVSLAQELGLIYVCAGHYATEQFGIQALGDWLKKNYSLDVFFISEANPV